MSTWLPEIDFVNIWCIFQSLIPSIISYTDVEIHKFFAAKYYRPSIDASLGILCSPRAQRPILPFINSSTLWYFTVTLLSRLFITNSSFAILPDSPAIFLLILNYSTHLSMPGVFISPFRLADTYSVSSISINLFPDPHLGYFCRSFPSDVLQSAQNRLIRDSPIFITSCSIKKGPLDEVYTKTLEVLVLVYLLIRSLMIGPRDLPKLPHNSIPSVYLSIPEGMLRVYLFSLVALHRIQQ